jgi:dihydroorotate dehydrogenase
MSHLPDPNGLRPTYNHYESYEWNFERGPVFDGEVVPRPASDKCQFLGLEVQAPIGVAAGPLLNSAWVGLYASLGFDILTYKTVRSLAHPVYDPPNLLFVEVEGMLNDERLCETLTAGYERTQPLAKTSMANTFGMPSLAPEEWREDVARAKESLRDGQVLVVSVVGTSQGEETILELAGDFA